MYICIDTCIKYIAFPPDFCFWMSSGIVTMCLWKVLVTLGRSELLMPVWVYEAAGGSCVQIIWLVIEPMSIITKPSKYMILNLDFVHCTIGKLKNEAKSMQLWKYFSPKKNCVQLINPRDQLFHQIEYPFFFFLPNWVPSIFFVCLNVGHHVGHLVHLHVSRHVHLHFWRTDKLG